MQQRVTSIDAVKGVALIAVVAIHSEPFLHSRPESFAWQLAGNAIQQLASFAVPFFFLAAGYLLHGRIDVAHPLRAWKAYVRRLVVPLIAWVIIDGVLQGHWVAQLWRAGSLKPLYWNALTIPTLAVHRPDLFLFRGTAVPLWFLVSLIGAVSVLALMVRWHCTRTHMVIAGLLSYAATLLMGTYALPLDNGTMAQLLEHRGPFIATSFVLLGFGMADSFRRANGTLAMLVFCLALVFAEASLVSMWRGEAFRERPYLMATLPLAMAVLSAALRHPGFGSGTPLPGLGRRSMGLYLMHIPVIGALGHLRLAFDSALWEVGFMTLVLMISIIAVHATMRSPWGRRILA